MVKTIVFCVMIDKRHMVAAYARYFFADRQGKVEVRKKAALSFGIAA
jgi:hypothetical protein